MKTLSATVLVVNLTGQLIIVAAELNGVVIKEDQ